jgi:hypothetical protein
MTNQEMEEKMIQYTFECPYCKTKWSTLEWCAETLCPGCDTVFDTINSDPTHWPPPAVWLGPKSSNQPKFDVKIRGDKVPGCMGIKVEKTSYKAHSDVQYALVAEFFNDPHDLMIFGLNDIEISLRSKPDLPPTKLYGYVDYRGTNVLEFRMGGLDVDHMNEQIAALWQKGDR